MKRTIGEQVLVEADVFTDGHDAVVADGALRGIAAAIDLGTDRLDDDAGWVFAIQA